MRVRARRYFGSQMFRAFDYESPAGVGGAQFIRNNYRDDTGTGSRIWDTWAVGGLFRGADVFDFN